MDLKFELAYFAIGKSVCQDLLVSERKMVVIARSGCVKPCTTLPVDDDKQYILSSLFAMQSASLTTRFLSLCRRFRQVQFDNEP